MVLQQCLACNTVARSEKFPARFRRVSASVGGRSRRGAPRRIQEPITESCKSCVCGHVFEDAKEIGGKRFSEYRAELYTRLENKRIKQLARRNKNANEQESGRQPLKERKANAIESRVTTSAFKPKTHSFKSKTCHRRIKGKRFSRPVNQSPSKTAVPPELVSRLPSALQEINRRLLGQNLMWLTMQLQ